MKKMAFLAPHSDKARTMDIPHVEFKLKFKLNSNNMANRQTSFSHQIELLESLKSYLHGFQERLAIVAEKYEKQVNDLYDAGGMMDETFNDFHDNYVEITKGKIL